MTVGERLKNFRLERRMTQDELGKLLGITKGAVQKYESGQIRNFKTDTIIKLCDIFGMPPAYFIYGEIPDLRTTELMDLMISYFGDWIVNFMDTLGVLMTKGNEK